MEDELINTLARLFERSTKDNIRQLGNSKIILQHGRSTMQITVEDARILAESIDNQEIETLLQEFDSRKSDEHLVIAYNEGKMIGTMTRL